MLRSYRCVVVANGLFPVGELALQMLKEAEFVIACDGAVLKLSQYREPDVIVGDLDSLPDEFRNYYAGRIHEEKEQETNDLTKAINYAEKQGYTEALILGATGLREDHTLGNISLLARYASVFERVEILSDYGIFTPVSRSMTFECEPGQQVSLFSLFPHGAISVTGLRYPIEKRRLLSWWEATLNEATGKEFTVILEEEAQILVYRALPVMSAALRRAETERTIHQVQRPVNLVFGPRYITPRKK